MEDRAHEHRIHVVEDDDGLRRVVIDLLRAVNIKVEAWSNPLEFLESPDLIHADLFLIDVRLPGMSGLEVFRTLRARGLRSPAIFISAFQEVSVAVEAMKLGAADFLVKPFGSQAFLDCVQRALLSRIDQVQSDRRRGIAQNAVAALSPREREVFVAVAEGKSNKGIAGDLGISEKTVEDCRGRMMRKVRAGSISDLVKIAILAGVCDPAVGLED